MSTWLELCQEAARECGVAQGGTYPTAVTDQTGILNKIVHWVKQSWIEIQNRPVEWKWMRVKFTLTTASGTASYAYGSATDVLTASAITRFGRWRVNDPRVLVKCYLQSAGVGTQYPLNYLDWNEFQNLYQFGSQENGAPAYITVDPQENLVIGPTPDDTYIISSEYERGPQVFSDGADVPEMPSRFHYLLVYEAMIRYGMDQSAPEVSGRGVSFSNMTMRQLEADQAETMTLAGPLA